MKSMGSDRGVSHAMRWNHIAIYKCTKSIHCTPSAYAMLHANYISIIFFLNFEKKMMAFGDRAFKEITKVKWGHADRP